MSPHPIHSPLVFLYLINTCWAYATCQAAHGVWGRAGGSRCSQMLRVSWLPLGELLCWSSQSLGEAFWLHAMVAWMWWCYPGWAVAFGQLWFLGACQRLWVLRCPWWALRVTSCETVLCHCSGFWVSFCGSTGPRGLFWGCPSLITDLTWDSREPRGPQPEVLVSVSTQAPTPQVPLHLLNGWCLGALGPWLALHRRTPSPYPEGMVL